MSLSVCCLAGASGPRVRALIEPLREVADEVVIAADARVDAATLAEYAGVADRLYRVEFQDSNRHFGLLTAQCSGEWVFRIDADEVGSPELVGALRGLTECRDVRQYWFQRAWLYGDASHALDEPPWWPDYQLRLFRKDCFVRFVGMMHTSVVSQPPSGYPELRLYHLDLLVNSFENRRKKAEQYDALRPGMTAPGGGAMNQRYYLPELARSLEIMTIPDVDAREVERVLGAAPESDLPEVGDLPVIPLAETDRWIDRRTFDPDVHRAKIVPIEHTIHLMPDEIRAIHFRVTNLGSEPWPWHNPELYEGQQVRLGYHWLNEDGVMVDDDGPRTWLPRRVHPGDSTVVPLMVQAPAFSATYILEVDLVHERWFGCEARVPVPVVPADAEETERSELGPGNRFSA